MLLSSMKEMNLKMTKQNYELLTGKKFGDREILDITKRHNGRWNETYAVCKCKCGSIDEVPLAQLRAGRQLRCHICAESIENKSTGVKNISYDRSKDRYVITLKRNNQNVIKHAHTMDEAILIKKQLLNHFETYGCFDVEKLKEEHATRKCSVTSRPTRAKKNTSKRKDYSYLIGQKLGNWEIISVSEPIKEKRRTRIVKLRHANNDVREVMLKNALRALQHDRSKPYQAESNTNIKNISYNKWLKYYQVQITRNGVLKTGSSKSLEEAIKIKERILKEFEKESVVNG